MFGSIFSGKSPVLEIRRIFSPFFGSGIVEISIVNLELFPAVGPVVTETFFSPLVAPDAVVLAIETTLSTIKILASLVTPEIGTYRVSFSFAPIL